MGRNSYFLVRHGQYMKNRDGETLTSDGIEDIHRASEELLARNLGARALILTSPSPRTYLTSGVIVQDFIVAGHEEPAVFESKRIEEGGQLPQAVRSLDEWVGKALLEAEALDDPDQPLIIVTHAPLIAIAKGLAPIDNYKVGYGEVFEYPVGTWKNPGFNRLSEMDTERKLGATG